MAMIVCKKCGNQVSSDVAFCRFCGAPVEPAEPPKAPEEQPAAQEAPSPAWVNPHFDAGRFARLREER